MAMALHSPSKIRGENRGVLKMSKSSLRDFATKVNAKAKKAIRSGHKPK